MHNPMQCRTPLPFHLMDWDFGVWDGTGSVSGAASGPQFEIPGFGVDRLPNGVDNFRHDSYHHVNTCRTRFGRWIRSYRKSYPNACLDWSLTRMNQECQYRRNSKNAPLNRSILKRTPSQPAITMLELHVWGPAFGLPSIDAECLATIAYFTQTINQSEYQLIQTSPSAVPTRT